MKLIKTEAYQTDDGAIFINENEARAHEIDLINKEFYKKIKDLLNHEIIHSSVVEINTILYYSKGLANILNEFNETIEKLENR